MTAGRLPGRPGVAALALREAVRSLGDPLRRLLRAVPRRRPRPVRILFSPQDLRTSDPTVADDIDGGLFVLAGHAVQAGRAGTAGQAGKAGRSPFDVPRPPPAWSEALLGFGWLRHLGAAGTPPAREMARALVADAAARRARVLERGTGRATPVVARRVVALLCGSSFLLGGADHAFYAAYLALLGRGVAALEADLVSGRRADRLAAAVALSYAALCCSGLENRLRRATRALAEELDRQILPDGGHVSRHPGLLAELLLDLLPLRLLFTSRGLEVPEALGRAIDRAVPMVKALRHGSGELAAFNGQGASAVDHLATLFAHEAARRPAPDGPGPSGYARLEAGGTLLLADVGAPPPAAFSTRAGAGISSFEWSRGPARVVVNCGAAREEPARLLARRTAAHSTLLVEGGSTASFLPDRSGPIARWLAGRLGSAIVDGPRPSASRAREEDGSERLVVRHDGWAKRFGVGHERVLRLGPDGSLSGEDRLLPEARSARVTAAIAVHFHLHPSVAVAPGPDRRSLRLTTMTGEPWLFLAETGEIALEASIYYAGPDRARPTVRVTVRPDPDVFHGETALRWHFLHA